MVKLLEHILSSCAFQKSERYLYESKGQKDILRCVSFKDSDCDYGYIYYWNDTDKNSDKAILHEDIRFTELLNVEFLNATPNKQNEMAIEAKPGESRIVLLRRVGEAPRFAC